MVSRRLSATVMGLLLASGGASYLSATSHAADANAESIAQGLQSFSTALSGLDSLEELADPVAFTGLLPSGSEGLALTQAFTQSLGDRLAAQLAGPGFDSADDLEDFLNDPDGNGDGADDGSVAGVTVDIGGTVGDAVAGVYDVTLTVSLARGGTTPLQLPLDGFDASGGALAKDLDLTTALTFRFDPAEPVGSQLGLLTAAPQALAVSLDLDLDAAPYDVDLGLTTVSVTGTADIGTDLVATLVDPTPDGRISQDDWEAAAALDLFDVSVTSSHADLSLTLQSDIPGVPQGTIAVSDSDLANGIDTPTVALGGLADFQNMTPIDFLGGLAHVAGALDALQLSGPADLDLPLMSDRLSEVLVVNERLEKFFTDTGLADPATPLTLGPGPGVTAEQYAAVLAGLDTLQEIEQPLAEALGIPVGVLAFAFNPTARRLELTVKDEVARSARTAELDLANQLERLGVVGVEDAASTIALTPSVALDIGVSVDLTPRETTETLLDKFAVETAGTELTVDAPITGDLDLVGKIGFLGLDLRDDDAGGAVALLERKVATSPMLSVDLDGGADDLLSLTELFAVAAAGPGFSTAAGSIAVDVNAQVPSFGLVARATAGGSEIAGGTVNVVWPDITVGAPTVTGDASFSDELLDFDFDHADPLALFSQITTALTTFADAVDGLAEQASGEVLSRDLPFAGRSFDDLANKLSEVSTAVEELLGDPPPTLQVLESRLEEAVGEALDIAPPQRSEILGVSLPGGSGPTSLVFDLSYGLCSAPAAGCTTVTGPLSLPFTLDLGDTAGGIVGTTGAGSVSVDYSALASLDFGVELPSVTGGTSLGSVPTVTGSVRPFVLDTSQASLSAGLAAGGVLSATVGPLELSLGNAADPVEAKLAAGIVLDNDVAPAGATRIAVPSADFTSFVGGLAPTDIGPADGDRVTCGGAVGGPHDACARIPVYDGPTKLGEITLTWADLSQLSGADGPQLAGAEEVFDALIGQGLDFGKVLAGMEQVLLLLTQSLDGASYGEKLPVVGDTLDAGAEVAEFVRTELVEPLQDLESQLSGVTDPAAIRTALQQFFVDALALPGGGSLLKQRDGTSAALDTDDVVVALLCDDGAAPGVDGIDGATPCTGVHNALHLYDVQVGFALGQTGSTGTPVDFDLGLPGLRLEMADEPGPADDLTASASWELDLAFGLSVREGFYLRTDNPNNQPGPGGNELALAAGLELPDNLKGDIAFLPFTLTDRTNPADPTAPKDLNLTVGLDLKGGGSTHRLAFTDLVSGVDPANDTDLDLVVGGDVNLDFHFETGPFGTEDSSVPTFVADFLLDGDFSAGTMDGEVGNLRVEFNNVGIDLGSLLGDFLGPILKEAGRVTKPLKPVVDIVTAPIPGLTDAAAAFGCPLQLPVPPQVNGLDLCTLSLLDLYERQSGTDLTLVRQLISLVIFVNAVNDAGGQPVLPLGSFSLNAGTAKAGPLAAGDKGSLLDMGSISPAGGEASLPKPLEKLAGAIKDVVADATKEGGDKGGFTFPAFDDPTRLFTMLLGQDVTLIHWDAGSLEAAVTVPIEIGPPIGPLPISLGLTLQFGVRGHFAVGYDTKGMRQAFQRLTNDDPNDDGALATVGTLFAGVGIDDRLRVNGEPTGEDIPEITLFGSVTAKAALDLLIVEAGIRGGVAAELDANLHDGGFGEAFHTDPTDEFSHHPENLDGVLRLDEIASFLGNPVCLFDYDGKITAFLEAYVDYTLGEESFTIVGPVTLYDFSEVLKQACATEPVLAHVAGGDLVLHAGAFADQREFQEDVADERFVVRQLDAAGTSFSVAAFGYEQEYSGISGKVFGDGGVGNDSITLEPGAALALGPEPPATGAPGDTVLSTVLPFTRAATLCGGPGNDVLVTGSATDTVVGDGVADKATLTCSTGELGTDGLDDIDAGPGNDTVFGTGGADKIKGGDGDDTIDAGTGNDTVLGGGSGPADGGDVIRGGPDSTGLPDTDVLFAGPGDDEVDGGAGPDTLDGDAGADTLRGGPGNDTIQGRAGTDLLEGQDDHDVLYGGEDDDDLRGGAGDDDLFGDAGDDTLAGGSDDDDLVGGRDNTGVVSDPDVGDTLNGEAGLDYLLGDEGTIVRPAGSDSGTIACTGSFAGDDTLNGGADADVLHGCGGVDLMHGDGAADLMLGGDGDDDMFGDDGPDQMFGDAGADDMQGGAGDDNPMRGGDGPDNMLGNDGADTMFGDSGDDLMKGNLAGDVMRGGPDADTMEGNEDADTVNGDGGDDLVIGGTSAAGQPDAGDLLSGSTGDDYLIGDNGVRGTLYDLDAGNAALGGKDTLDGGDDQDRGFGGLDEDVVRGGPGADHLEGNVAADAVYGDAGPDDVIGGSSQRAGTASYTDVGDLLSGGAGDDVVLGDNGDVTAATAGTGTDVTRGRGMGERAITLYDLGYSPDATRSGPDQVHGDDGTDVLLGQGAGDTVHGGGGDDFAAGGQDSDVVHGDGGDDDLVGGSYVVHAGTGPARTGQLDSGDTLYGGDAGDVLLGDNGTVLRGSPVKSDVTKNRGTPERTVELYDLVEAPEAGTFGSDWLLGEAGPDMIFGQHGTDRITGGSEADYAEGGPDNDWVEGNSGRDDLVGGSSAIRTGSGRTAGGHTDTVDVIWGGPDDDLIVGDNAVVTRFGPSDELTRRLGTNPTGALTDGRALQLLDLGGDVNAAGTLTAPAGRFGDDILSGQGGVDVVLGQDGADSISGGSGDDYVEGHGGSDSIVGDTALTGVPTTPGPAPAAYPATATPGYADDGGAPGQDDLIGGKSEPGFRDGADTIRGDDESDFVLGDNGTAVRRTTGAGASLSDAVYALRYAPNDLAGAAKIRYADSDFPSTRFCEAALPACERAGASGSDLLFGDAGDDFLYGQDGADQIRGGADDDDIYGELGNDLLWGDAGEDAILGDRGGVRDRYETGANTFRQSRNGAPKVEFEGFTAGTVTRVTDLLHDVNGDVFVGAGATAKMPHNGAETGGDDRIRGGLDHDTIHAGFGDDLANGDSGGDSVFGDDGADVLWGGQGCDATTDTPASKPYCFPGGTFDPAPHLPNGETDPRVTDYLLGGKGGTSASSVQKVLGSDILDWRPRGSYAPGTGCTTEQWPVDLMAGRRATGTTLDPCRWFEMTDILPGVPTAATQHHQGVDWQYGGWGRDVLQADVSNNGPNEGDRMLDWNGNFNLFTLCNSSYGGYNITRMHSPAWQAFLQKWVYAQGGGQTLADLTTGGTSAFVEIAIVYPGKDNAHGSGKAYPGTPGHFDRPNACAP